MRTTFSIKGIIPYLITLTMFMEGLDTTIINTAIPAMSRSLQVNPIDLKIALISYLLSLAIFIPISGWIADKFGMKRVFISALAVFTLSSLWCGFASNLHELVVARTVQGLGGSLMLPVGRLIIVRTFARNEFINTMSRVVMIGSLGPMLGPVLSGIITHHFSWRWIFWVNIPVGIIAIIIAWIYLIDIESKKVPRLDKIGFLLFGSGLAGLTFGFSAFSETTFSFSSAIIIILSSVSVLILYIFHSHHQQNPIVNTQLWRFSTFRISFLGNLLARLGIGGVPFLLPLLLQVGVGYSAQLAGLLLAPIALGLATSKFFMQFFLRQLGFKRHLILNTIFLGFSLWTFISINTHTPIFIIALLTFIFGSLTSLQYGSMNPLAYAEIPADSFASVSSIMSTTQQLAQSFGVALCAILLRYFSRTTHIQNKLNIIVFQYTFLMIGFITIFSALIFTQLHSDDGHQLIE